MIALLFALSCGDKDPVDSSAPTDSTAPVIDEDGDGYRADVDCDDSNPDINPGAAEVCNDLDDNCNDVVDENPTDAATWYTDADGDGYGFESDVVQACTQPSGYADNVDDCDDGDAAVHPDATEVCNGLDDDCDELVDDADDPVEGKSVFYEDLDGDGYGTEVTTEACEAPSGYAEVDGDCDDDDADFHPDATEDDCADPNDYNCDGSVAYEDEDGDGWAACEECDDSDDSRNPGVAEVCNGIDDDCDGTVPADETDDDGDGMSECDGDCDDTDDGTYDGADEYCDEVDNDCDGDTDEDDALDVSEWYLDDDGDGYGDASVSTESCEAPTGYVSDDTDCDDTDADEYPGADEECDSEDNDCDSAVDEDVTYTTWYADTDGDGYGDPSGRTTSDCIEPSGYSATSDDCDDADSSINPGADELCDGDDNDCDGDTDEDDATDASTWYADDDEDGYGDASDTTTACDQPSGYISDNTDCDDTDADEYPGADEYCDGDDDDCDGTVDEDDAIDASTWYADDDGDGYGDASDTTAACSVPTGYSGDSTDCDDTDSAINPGATEVCNSGVDDDCDGDADEDDPSLSGTTYYADSDGDGYGDSASGTTEACSTPSGYSTTDDDCDDSDSGVNPGATEVCNSTDDDCNGSVDDDASDATTYYIDSDGDGYGDSSTTTTSCSSVTGYVTDDTDCDDSDADVSPGASESANCVDDDCDSSTDEGASYTYTHDSDIQSIWTSKCSTCHTTGSSGGLSLSSSAYSKIVNVASSDVSSMDLVDDTCDTDDSYIWHKLQGTHSSVGGAGSTMPKTGSMTSAELAKIETWIEEGAPN